MKRHQVATRHDQTAIRADTSLSRAAQKALCDGAAALLLSSVENKAM
jgi:hypothetical protein